MADVNVQVSEDVVIGLDMPAWLAGRFKRVELSFHVAPIQLRPMLEALGGAERFELDPAYEFVSRRYVPVTRDGENVGNASLVVWVPEGEPVEHVRSPVIKALRDELDAARAEAINDD